MFGREYFEEKKVIFLPARTAASPKLPSASPTTQASARKSTQAAPPVEKPYEIKSNRITTSSSRSLTR